VAAVVLGIWRPWKGGGDVLAQLTWGEVTRGDLEVVVSSTGTLEAVHAVEVGTQVSGTITEINVDFNDRVAKGQILAVIDTSLLDSALRDAQAGHARAKAQFDQAEADYQARKELFDGGLLSQTEIRSFDTARTAARSSLDSAESQVERARQNRSNAVIRSPIDGVVVERAVEVGQTVAASFSTPRLFLLARDLRDMRILAEVDEGDIGQIQLDQEVGFQVAAQPDRQFHGKVRQIRLQPKVDQNVVKYTVVVDAANPDGVLLPGMTATLEFVVERVVDALTVPVAATRIRPSAAMSELLPAQPSPRGTQGGPARPPRPEGGVAGSGMPADLRRIFLRDEQGGLTVRMVRVGVTDGRRVEIVPLQGEIAPGAAVVIGAPTEGSATPGGAPRSGTGRPGGGFRVL
jgi:HlyD family secretion protein